MWADDEDNELVDEHPQPTADSHAPAPHHKQSYPAAGAVQEESRPRQPRGPTALPDRPPFSAFVGNLHFKTDVDELGDFFYNNSCQVKDVKIPQQDGRARGFGYVEFEDLESLKKALELTESELHGRQIHVDVAAPRQQTGGRSGGFGGGRPGFGGRDGGRDGPRDAPRGGERGGFERREPREGGFGGGFERREPREGGFERREPREGGRSGFGFGGDRRQDDRHDAAPVERREVPAERPKLHLLPATKAVPSPVAPVPAAAAAAAAPAAAKVDPFGAAKPVDTAAALKRLEEKIAQQAAAKPASPAAPRTTGKPSSDWQPAAGPKRTSRDSTDAPAHTGDAHERRGDKQVYRPPQRTGGAGPRAKPVADTPLPPPPSAAAPAAPAAPAATDSKPAAAEPKSAPKGKKEAAPAGGKKAGEPVMNKFAALQLDDE